MQRVDGAERLHHRRGGVMADLNGGRTYSNVIGGRGNQADQHRGRGAGDCHEVVFGDPVSSVSPTLDVLREVDGCLQSLPGRGPFTDR
jgi:hypothetical protein